MLQILNLSDIPQMYTYVEFRDFLLFSGFQNYGSQLPAVSMSNFDDSRRY